MAKSDLIVDLVRAGVKGDDAAIRTTAEAIAANERAKRHTGLADRISRALLTTLPPNGQPKARPGIRVSDGSGGIQRRIPERALADMYLSPLNRAACEEIIEEQLRADVLRAHGLEPRSRILLMGPPGNGKTSLAECIAQELSLPLMCVRYDAVVTSYLGETAQRLRRLFDYVRTEPSVLFFDEFDAIGKERGDLHETGEIKRVVTTLLLQLDDLPSYCVVIGATNHPELLDRAAWRRFQLRLELGSPDDEQMTAYFEDRLEALNGKPGYTAKRLQQAVAPKSYSEAEEFFLGVQRKLALSQGGFSLRTILDDRVRAWTARAPIPSAQGEDERATDTASA